MGWTTWASFRNDINENLVLEIADALVTTGLRDAGYTRINLDAGVWLPDRDPLTDSLRVDPTKFPHGLRALSGNLSKRGFGLGLYTDLSNRTVGKVCGTGPGSFGHFKRDADTIALEANASFVKIDYCAYDWSGAHVPTLEVQLGYWGAFRDAFNATGRPVYQYFCPRSRANTRLVPTAPANNSVIDGPPLRWNASTRRGLANALLTEFHNAYDDWKSVLSNLDAMLGLGRDSGVAEPGAWTDGDMLLTCGFGRTKMHGNGMSLTEYKASFATWAVLASQLILSVDPRLLLQASLATVGRHQQQKQQLQQQCLTMLKNPDILRVNQRGAGPPRLLLQEPAWGAISSEITAQVIARPLQGDAYAVLLLNRNVSSSALQIPLSQVLSQRRNQLEADDHGTVVVQVVNKVPVPSKVVVSAATGDSRPVSSSCEAREAIEQIDLGRVTGNVTCLLPSHGACL
eukprot:UC1_evm1s1765